MVESAVSEFMDDPNSKSMHRISPIPLDSQSFAAFGDVLEATGKHRIAINEGTTVRFHDLAKIDVEKDGGKPIVNIFRGTPYPFPLTIRMMEKHPFGSQLFMPLEPFEVPGCRGRSKAESGGGGRGDFCLFPQTRCEFQAWSVASPAAGA